MCSALINKPGAACAALMLAGMPAGSPEVDGAARLPVTMVTAFLPSTVLETSSQLKAAIIAAYSSRD